MDSRSVGASSAMMRIGPILKVRKPVDQLIEFGCVRLEQSGVEHLLVILPEGFKGFSGRYQTEETFDCISIFNQLSGLIILSKEMLFVSGDIFSQVSVIDRFRRYASTIETIKIVPVTRIAITTPECAS